jgi:hypothetical protein
LLVEVGEAKEDLDIFIKLKLRPFLNTLKGYKIAKKLNKLNMKGVFREFGV